MENLRQDDESIERGPVSLPTGSERVTDADEEIFILYSELQQAVTSEDTSHFRGLGHLDSRRDLLQVKFELKNVSQPSSPPAARRSKQRKLMANTDKTIEIELFQDKTALRSRSGDTGSVLWKASVDFAQVILQQDFFHPSNTLFNHAHLRTQHVLELGAGTGLLSIALSSLVGRYTATDIGPLIPLIRKNMALNFPGWPNISGGGKGANIFVEELDWISIESATPSQRLKVYDKDHHPIDLLLVVDCIYHPALLPPFLATIDYLTTPGKTAVLIVSELRAEDVMRDFLEGWLNTPGWEIWRIPNDDIGKRYAVFLGWKE